MRQRLSSEPDRYRGRRRVPTPPRSRYAAVGLSAFVGAGVVAWGAASALPDAKAINPTVLAGFDAARLGADQLAQRDNGGDRASRAEDRTDTVETKNAPVEVAPEDVWLLPMDKYTFTSPFGVRWGVLHGGIDLAVPEGTPYKAVHAGVVTQAGYNGGYGFAVTVRLPDGTDVIYAHSQKVLVQVGQQVKAGDRLGYAGITGFTMGDEPHLHLEIHDPQTLQPIDPIPFLRDHGVDIKLGVESIYSTAS